MRAQSTRQEEYINAEEQTTQLQHCMHLFYCVFKGKFRTAACKRDELFCDLYSNRLQVSAINGSNVDQILYPRDG